MPISDRRISFFPKGHPDKIHQLERTSHSLLALDGYLNTMVTAAYVLDVSSVVEFSAGLDDLMIKKSQDTSGMTGLSAHRIQIACNTLLEIMPRFSSESKEYQLASS